jgi:hypothetical protein
MAQHSASSERADVGLGTRVSQSPPGGLLCGGIAILVMVLALAGVLPHLMFFVGSAALVAVAYTLDKRFKAVVVPPTAAASPVAAGPDAAVPDAAVPDAAVPDAADPVASSTPPPSLLPISDLRAEHTRLTRELTDRVDDDEDVRFDKFMRLRRLEEEIERQQAAGPT